MAQLRTQHGLTDDEITDIILKYIDEEIYNYAIMIDGEWGCGKTYYIKESLIEAIEDHENQKTSNNEEYKVHQVIYISLYGIKSIDEISKQVFMKSYLSKAENATGLGKAGVKVVGTVLPALFDVINNKIGTSLSVDNVSDNIEKFLPARDKIFIFDDLERCDCPINEILGYINSFVEQDGLKVILVANQKEIGRSTYQVSQELKYLVAAHLGIKFDENTSGNNGLEKYIVAEKQNDDKLVQVSLNEVKERINRLFGQNTSYEQIKEKLVGQTIYYYPDLKQIFVKLIENRSINESLQDLLVDTVEFFQEHMVNEGHPNLRTFQFYLSKIKDLYDVIMQLEGEGQQTFLSYIIRYSFKICVSYKSGAYKYDWTKNEEYGQKAIGKVDIFGTDLNFRFVDDFVVDSKLDKDRAERMLRVYEDMYCKKKTVESDCLHKLQSGWLTCTEAEVEESISTLLQALSEDKYNPTIYSQIIGMLLILEDAGFSKQYLQKAIESMKSNIQKLEYTIVVDSGYRIESDTGIGEKHREIVSELQQEMDRHHTETTASQIEKYISGEDGWASRLVDYLKSIQLEITNKTGFLSQINITKLSDKLIGSTARDIHFFRICINSIYKEGSIGIALSDEAPLLDELYNKIKESDIHLLDKIQKLQIRYLLKNIESVRELYEAKPEVIPMIST